MNQQILDLIANLKTRNAAMGLDVRCPTCNHGIGKFCLKDGVTRHDRAEDIVIHPARVALAREQGFIA